MKHVMLFTEHFPFMYPAVFDKESMAEFQRTVEMLAGNSNVYLDHECTCVLYNGRNDFWPVPQADGSYKIY